MYRVPKGWTKQGYITYLRDQARRNREEAIYQQEQAEKRANKQQQNQTANSLITAGTSLGGKYLYNQLPSIKSMIGSEAAKQVGTEAAKQVGTEAAKQVGTEAVKQGGTGMTGLSSGLGTALGAAAAGYGAHKTIQAIDGKQGRKASGMGGAMTGAAIGSFFGPAGMLAGALIGGAGGAAMGHLRSGKSQEQQARDDARKEFLHSMGREKRAGDFSFDLGEGKKFDFGLDGGARFKGVGGNELKAYDMDMANPLAGKASSYANVIAGAGGFLGSQLASQVGQGIMSNATDEATLKTNALKVLQAQGVSNAEQALAKFQAQGINDPGMVGIVNDLYGSSVGSPQPTGAQGGVPTAPPTNIDVSAQFGEQSKNPIGSGIEKPLSGETTLETPSPGSGTFQPFQNTPQQETNPSGISGVQGVQSIGEQPSLTNMTPEQRAVYEQQRKLNGGLASTLGM